MGKGIYLAGKISKNGWRHQIVRGLDATCAKFYGYEHWQYIKWPILSRAIFDEWDYVGPYFVACDHGCFHGTDTHGWDSASNGGICPSKGPPDCEDGARSSRHGRSQVATWCMGAIERADLVFAWIESPDAHGTFAEIGAAHARGKTIVVASPEYIPDLWFVYSLGTRLISPSANAAWALRTALESWRCFLYDDILESPIEKRFFVVGVEILPGLQPQYPVGPYRADFALPQHQTLIELDGHDYHKTKEQRTHDAKRDRYLEEQGWRVVRFTGTEVWHDPEGCAYSVRDIIRANGGNI